MSFNVVPKLSFASAVSVSASLCCNEPLTASLLTAAKNVDLLPLPENLKKEVLCLIQPVGEQIQVWLKEFQSVLDGHRNLYRKLSWTSLGIIDYERTAGNCAWSGEWGNIQAFKLACGGSDPESIYRLWPIVKDNVIEEISQNGLAVHDFSKAFPVNFSKRLLLWFNVWVSYLCRTIDEFGRVNNCTEDYTDVDFFLFKLALKANNAGAARFFNEKLRIRVPDVRYQNNAIVAFAKDHACLHLRHFKPSIFIFMVSQMNEEEVKDVLHHGKIVCLINLLAWPLLQFVVPMSELVWSTFDLSREMPILLQRVLTKIMQTQVPVAYERVFKALWLKIPPPYQREFFDVRIYGIISNLFEGYSPEEAMRALFKGDPEAYQKFLRAFIPNPSAVISMSVEDNNFKAFKNILQKYFVKEDLVEDFENVYAKYTQVYVNEYYGNGISSESLSDTESE